MKVFITGGAGFIGSHLAEAYLRLGDEVVAVDNEITGSRRNLSAAEQLGALTYVRADVVHEFDRVVTQLDEMGWQPEFVLHFASPASPVDYDALPIETMHVNSRGTENCVRAAQQWGARFLYASTSEAYGDPLEHPQRETYWGNVNPVGPRSCYDESKRYGEAFVSTVVRKQGLDGRIVRIFNTYGPRMRLDDGRVVPNFIVAALGGRPLTVYGDGSQTRSFCYVDDLVDGVIRCAASESTRGRVVNLGNPEEHTILEFAQIVARAVGVPLVMEDRPLPEDDPNRRCPDISLARELLDWEPRVPLREGLERTIDDFRAALGARVLEV